MYVDDAIDVKIYKITGKMEMVVVDGVTFFKLENNKLDVFAEDFPMTEDVKTQLANSSNKVSVLGYLWSVYPLASDHPLKKMKDFVDGMLLFWNHEERGFAGLEENSTTLEEYIIANGLVDDFAGFLKDVSGQEFKFKEAKAGDKQLICDMGDGVPFNRTRCQASDCGMPLWRDTSAPIIGRCPSSVTTANCTRTM